MQTIADRIFAPGGREQEFCGICTPPPMGHGPWAERLTIEHIFYHAGLVRPMTVKMKGELALKNGEFHIALIFSYHQDQKYTLICRPDTSFYEIAQAMFDDQGIALNDRWREEWVTNKQ